MARPSTIDTHEHRAEIETAIVNGTSYRDIAGHYGVTRSAVERHAKKLSERLAEENVKLVGAKRQHSVNVLDEMEDLKQRVHAIMQRAEDQGKDNTALGAVRELTRIFDLYVKIAAEERARQQADITKHPEFVRYQRALAQVLRNHPDLVEEFEHAFDTAS